MLSTSQQLSVHFSLVELTTSREAVVHGIDNTPSAVALNNLATVLAPGLERVRFALQAAPIQILSGYRCPALNALVRGTANSAHLAGLAADFIAPVFGTPREICHRLQPLLGTLRVDQLIMEGTWVHVGFAMAAQNPRGQMLTARFGPGGTTYIQGLA